MSEQMKLRFFFPLLVTILVTAACGGDVGSETAVNSSAVLPTSSKTPITAADAPTAPSAATAAAAEAAPAPALPVLGPAPAWKNDVWINNEMPLTLDELRGKVVLLEFWTFG